MNECKPLVTGGAAKKNEANKAAVKEVANKEEFLKYVANAAAADQAGAYTRPLFGST